MTRLLVYLLVFGLFYHASVESANILVLSSIPSPSHMLWNFKIVEELVKRGHNVTVLSVDKPKNGFKGAHVFYMEEIYEQTYGSNELDLSEFLHPRLTKEIDVFFDFMYVFCEKIGKAKGFKSLLAYPDNFKFDLVLNDFTCASCTLGFLHKFNYPPVVGISAYKYTTRLVEIMGGHFYSGYIPRPTALFGIDMSIFQRTQNLGLVLYEMLTRKYIFQPKFDALTASMHGDKNLPSIFDLERKQILALINTHPSTDFPIPLPPNVVEVGGLQISEPQPLPNDLEEFIQKSKKGVILIAFGTNIHEDVFDQAKQNIIVSTVRKFPDYHFLWKFERDVSEGKVANLMVRKWLPQNDILAHPKIKAFVSHGGGLSTQEATWHGVPVIAVPFFMDQKTNTFQSVLAGVAVQVDITKFNEEDMVEAIRAILKNPVYGERMKMRSIHFRNRAMKPLDEAIWWIENALRDGNLTHLRSPVLDLGHFTANAYDILLLSIVVLIFGLLIVYKSLLVLCTFIFGKQKRTKTKMN